MGLKEYVTRRVFHLVITYWAFVTVLFGLFRLLPGDPTTLYLQSGMTPEERQRALARLGLDRPLYVQYFDYVTDLLTGDLGWSFRHKTEVFEVLATKFWNTIFLMGTALVLAYLIGVLLGAILGWWRGTRREKTGLVGVLIARSSPEFWTGIVLLMVFVFWLDWFPSGRMRAIGVIVDGFWDKYLAWDFVYHMILPLTTAVLYYMTMPVLVMRSGMVNILTSDFIEIKKAEGLPEWTILYKHAARNSVLPVVTIAAVTSGVAIGGSLVIETVFNWPGMGRAMVEAVSFNDYQLAMGAFFLMGSFVILMNFAADLLYVYLDPRVTYGGEQ